MTSWATGLGVTLAAGLLATLPISLAVLPDEPDLRVTAPSSRAFIVRDSEGGATPPIAIEPAPAPAGLAVTDSAPGSRLDLRTWRVNYSHRWEREVTLPILTGPFVREGDEVCGLSLSIGAALFDTSGAGAGFQQILQDKLNELLPYTYTHPQYEQVSVTFPKPKLTTMRIGLVPDRLVFFVHLILEDGTLLEVYFVARFVAPSGTPALIRQGPVFHNWRGPTLDRLLQEAEAVGASVATEEHPVLAFFFEDAVRSEGARVGRETAEREGNAEADRKLTEFVDSTLTGMSAGLANLRGPHHPIAANPTASVSLRVNGPPIVSKSGIALRLCASVQIGTKVDPAVPGSVKSGAPASRANGPTGDATIELSADGDTLNHLLYLLWQSGALRELGTSRSVVQAVLERTKDADGSQSALQKLAFDFRGFDPGLPPTITPGLGAGDALGFSLGDVKIGDWDERRVVAHAAGSLAIGTAGDKVTLAASVKQLTANCASSAGGQMVLTPCVSDLMPTVRASLVDTPVQVGLHGGDLLAKLPTMSFGGGQVHLSNLRATAASNPVRLSVSVQARITGASR